MSGVPFFIKGVEGNLKMTAIVESYEQIPDWENILEIAWSPRKFDFVVLDEMKSEDFKDTGIIFLIAEDQTSCTDSLLFIEQLHIPVVCNFKRVDLHSTKDLINKNGRALVDHHISVGKLREVFKTVADGGLYFSRTKEAEPFLTI